MKLPALKSKLLALMFAASAVTPTVWGQQPKISVGPNVHVSAANSDKNHGEVLMSADPKDPSRLIGCSMIFPDPMKRRLSDGIVYSSGDGGEHWTQTLYVDKGDFETGDPACAFGSDGKAYSAFLAVGFKSGVEDVLFYRSNDGGKTWMTPAFVDRSIDREYVTVDNTGGKYDGHIYINGTGGGSFMDPPAPEAGEEAGFEIGITIQQSTDGGASFRSPLNRFSVRPHYVLGMGNGTVLSDGTYIALFGELKQYSGANEVHPKTANAFLRTISSTDGGETFGMATTVSDWYMNFGEIGSTSSVVPVIAADRSAGPFKDRVYAVWPDFRSGRGEILLSYSTDKGKSWSKPLAVNDDRPWPAPASGPDDVMPAIDVNRNGVVGVMWYDRRENPHNLGWWVRFAASTDGGDTFSSSVKVSEAPATVKFDKQIQLDGNSYGGGKPTSESKTKDMQVNIGFGDVFTYNGGHTVGMAADAGGAFHPFWIDNRTGVEQIWTARVSVDGSVTKYGSSDLADLDDVTDKVTLDFKNGKYDKSTGTVSIDAYLSNTSQDTVKGPIKVRIVSLDSKVGAPSVVNGDNHITSSGAVWDFTPETPNGQGLAPGESTKAKRLIFKVSGVQFGEKPPAAEDLRQFISMQAKVLAPKVSPAPVK
jgi:hypothetical protein